MHLIREFFHRPSLIALIPAIAVVFDYAMTITFSGGRDAILAFEYSPLLRAAIASDLLIPCIAALAIGYYGLGLFALRSLARSGYYIAGVLLLALISLTHISGGLSWIVRNSAYSNAVLLLAVTGILVALGAFLFALRRGTRTPAPL
jgi:hypothetical protein